MTEREYYESVYRARASHAKGKLRIGEFVPHFKRATPEEFRAWVREWKRIRRKHKGAA